jgi:1-acyl-sn-glycerol-3-phosphate acyltransferase
VFYTVVRAAVAVWARLFLRWRAYGSDNMPRAGGVILACNHTSYLDPPLAAISVARHLRFLAKEELFRIPVLGSLITALGSVPIARGRLDRAGFKRAERIVRSGQALLIFPEGTRSPDGRLLPAEPGVGLLVLRTGAPVVPMAIVGSDKALPRNSVVLRPAKVTVRLGRSISFPEYLGKPIDRQTAKAVADRIMQAIAALLPPDQR